LKKIGKVIFYSAMISGGVLLAVNNKDEIAGALTKVKTTAYESITKSIEANETIISPENIVDSKIYTIHEGDTLNALSWEELESLSNKNGIDANKEFNGSEVNSIISRAQMKAADQNGNLHPGDSFEMKIGKLDSDYQLNIDPVE
jgi:hypothetical protein